MIRITKEDEEILYVLWRWGWLCDYQIGLLIGGESRDYIKRRLKRFRECGLVKRQMVSIGVCANWLTREGLDILDVMNRNVLEPNRTVADHDKIVNDILICLMRKEGLTTKDITTERDIKTQYKNGNGGIHIPDGFIVKEERCTAVEYERTLKRSPRKTILQNIEANRERFHSQIWVSDKSSIIKIIKEITADKPFQDEIQILSLAPIEENIHAAVRGLPHYKAQRGGMALKSMVHITNKEPLALASLPKREDVMTAASLPMWEEV